MPQSQGKYDGNFFSIHWAKLPGARQYGQMDRCDTNLREVSSGIQAVKYNVLKDYHFDFLMEEMKGHRGSVSWKG